MFACVSRIRRSAEGEYAYRCNSGSWGAEDCYNTFSKIVRSKAHVYLAYKRMILMSMERKARNRTWP